MKLNELLQKVKDSLKVCLTELGYFDENIEIILETPKDKTNGDLSSNVAMRYARIARKAPFMIAEEIKNALNTKGLFVKEVVVAKPGFINFFLDKTFLLETITEINKLGSNFGNLEMGKDEHYNIEFVSVNPTGALHIGHARGAAAGDSLSRILQKAGYKVTKEYYVNDAGNQIHNLALSIDARYKQLFNQKVDLPEDGYRGPEIIETAKEIKAIHNDKFLNEDGYEFFREYGVESLLVLLRKDLKAFNVEFDVWFSEKSLYDNKLVKETIDYLIKNDYTYEEEGAIWLKTSDYEDEKDRVIIKSDKTFTYLTPDIAYHKNKLDRGYTKLIDILGGDHHGYINRLKAAIEMVGGKSDLLEVELLQMVKVLQNGIEVKMSKRSGKAIVLSDLVEEVGSDPIRYFFAARSLSTQMDLDLDLAIRQTNENPVYYVQYAHARINSIFEAAKTKGVDISNLPTEFKTIANPKAFELVNILANYPNIIEQSATQRAPHKLTNYIQQLASAFHSFYNAEQVITTDQLKTREHLSLLNAAKIILKDSLSLIGVSAPNKM
ncbi:Arginine--tRNA ligase [Candidatus Izimaplasma bacterium HR1]|jgi:arginyl-tRNA synthetase|uniref:arginine--tRNA ligase n=1 Tax=Candidatus Izimoplasma sp. HR1 TaxID=1541959 RepID=UPI0004F6AD14|nr:Arginine--tRNA ligase [Candidatus Izimaplasma bacterium HR1]